jgi:peptidoglycan/LPS O-acetylase OafA/YrhL
VTTLITHDEFKATKFFTPLDGIRALSVLLVVLWHMPEKTVFGKLNGWTGVTMFFILSGFLITTLCLREAARHDGGRFDLVAFYIRRVHRILPL